MAKSGFKPEFVRLQSFCHKPSQETTLGGKEELQGQVLEILFCYLNLPTESIHSWVLSCLLTCALPQHSLSGVRRQPSVPLPLHPASPAPPPSLPRSRLNIGGRPQFPDLCPSSASRSCFSLPSLPLAEPPPSPDAAAVLGCDGANLPSILGWPLSPLS